MLCMLQHATCVWTVFLTPVLLCTGDPPAGEANAANFVNSTTSTNSSFSHAAPPPISPGRQSKLLAVCPQLPPSMQRPEWCLADYTVVDRLYKGYASKGEDGSRSLQFDCTMLQASLLITGRDLVNTKHSIHNEMC